jgi:hypothetical protein
VSPDEPGVRALAPAVAAAALLTPAAARADIFTAVQVAAKKGRHGIR